MTVEYTRRESPCDQRSKHGREKERTTLSFSSSLAIEIPPSFFIPPTLFLLSSFKNRMIY